MTSKCGKNKKVAHEPQLSVSLMFLPHFDVLCDLLLNRRTVTWNLFVLYNKELKYTEKSFNDDVINTSVLRVCLSLRRLERVFRCCSVCETMEGYKDVYLIRWANYMSPCNSIAGLYFEGTCDVISVTMATHKVHKNVH